jgi:hypothetical protein
MIHPPPLNDLIAFSLAGLVDDAQKDRRDPSHSDIEYCIKQCGLSQGDPNAHGQTVGKSKRVRAVLSWAIENSFEDGRRAEARRFLDENTGPDNPRVYRNAALLLCPSKDGLEIAAHPRLPGLGNRP